MGKGRRTGWNEREDATANARRELPRLAAEYFARVRRVLEKEPSPEKLHRLRLATKRLRYTLELFRPCYGPGLETRLAALRDIQQSLGEVNDCIATARMLPKSAPARAWLDRRTSAKAEEFRKRWAQEFGAPGQESRWTAYLSRNVRRSSVKSRPSADRPDR